MLPTRHAPHSVARLSLPKRMSPGGLSRGGTTLRRRKLKKYTVLSYDPSFIDMLDEFYTALKNLGGTYRFMCRRGRCWSIIEGDEDVGALLASMPGLRVEECRGTCRESYVLLPPPPAPLPPRPLGAPQGPLIVGTSGGIEVGLDEHHLWTHIGIFGATGSGKSHTAARIIRCAAEALEVAGLVLDWHNEYYMLVPDAKLLTGHSLPQVPLLTGSMGVDEAISMLEQVLGLSRNQSLILTILLAAASVEGIDEAEAILSQLFGQDSGNRRLRAVARLLLSARTLRDFLRAVLEAYHARAVEAPKGELEAWAALIRRLAMLGLDERYANLFTLRVDNAPPPPLRESEVAIIDLSSILNPLLRRLYAMLLLEYLYVNVQQGTLPPLAAVVEEAHNFSDTTTLLHLLTEARKYRLGLIVVSTTPRAMPSQALANMNTLFVHRTVSPDDMRALEEVLPEAQALPLPKLPSGMALLHAQGLEEPVLLQVHPPRAPCRAT